MRRLNLVHTTPHPTSVVRLPETFCLLEFDLIRLARVAIWCSGCLKPLSKRLLLAVNHLVKQNLEPPTAREVAPPTPRPMRAANPMAR